MAGHGMGALIYKLRGLSLVRRWNFHYTTKDENVAEHSYWVAVYAMFIADMENSLSGQAFIPVDEVMRAALVHDWEEAVTGDLPSLVKRTCNSDWDKVAKAGIDEIFSSLTTSHPVRAVRALWGIGSEPLGDIVKAGDLLSRIMYAYDEMQRGNQAFKVIVEETVMELHRLGLESVRVILQELGLDSPGRELPDAMTHL